MLNILVYTYNVSGIPSYTLVPTIGFIEKWEHNFKNVFIFAPHYIVVYCNKDNKVYNEIFFIVEYILYISMYYIILL